MQVKVNGRLYETDHMEYYDVLDLKVQLEEEIDAIKSQLDQYRIDYKKGISGDYEWFKSARDAAKIKGKQAQRLQLEIGRRKRAQKQKDLLRTERLFVDICRERMSKEEFHGILEEVRLRKRAASYE
jgi:hypothetical protein